jgi:hypothetical protein
MNLTRFESEIVDSLLWQIKGFKDGYVSERATNRILRASLRRIKHRLIGYSEESKKETATDKDHAIPIKVIIQMLMEEPNLSKNVTIEILRQFYISVTITKYEHTVLLKKLGLASKMPNDWNGVDPLARYKKAGIQVVETK